MNNDFMREQFETWIKRRLIGISLTRVVPLGLSEPAVFEYEALVAQQCWETWLASRKAIEIELPEERWGDRFADGFNYMYSKAYDAIEAAGLKVKP